MTKKQAKHIISDNLDCLSQYSVKKLAFFGSIVRNEQTENSDIDVLVEFNKASYKNFIGLTRELEALFDCHVDLVTFKALDKHIKQAVLKEAEYCVR